MIGTHKKLKKIGVLGINRRNAHYTLGYNQRRYYPLVDDKLKTKQLAVGAGITVPELYALVEMTGQVEALHGRLEKYEDFVIKPGHGSGGEGIVVVTGRTGSSYRTASGAILSREEVNHHLYDLLSGMFSLGSQPDQALVEYRVKIDPVFEAVSYSGVPDVRIIVFLGVPVMAMVRLPTSMSRGKANLHQGAIGAGVDLATGRTLSAVWKIEIVHEHPDTGNSISGLVVPHWPELLRLAAGACDLTGLGYLGVDMVLDKDKGPMVLEMNARPGLAIQIANRAGLLTRLRAVEERAGQLGDWPERVSFAVDRFATIEGI